MTYFSYGLVLETSYNISYQKSVRYTSPLNFTSTTQEIELAICTTKEDFTEKSKALTKRLVKRCYHENETQEQILKTFTNERDHLLNQTNQTESNRIPLILTYNRTFADIKRAVNKHWDIIKISRDFREVLQKPL